MKRLMILPMMLTAFVLSMLLYGPTQAAERDYVQANCAGQIEYVLADYTRVDCLTERHAIEYDFGHKWAESVGQSLHYAANTGRRAGIVLIVESRADELGSGRLHRLIDHYGLPIDHWVVP